jgi:phage terminase small subunit
MTLARLPSVVRRAEIIAELSAMVLKNARHERFAQAVASGEPADEAYKAAGYKPDRAHASRLAANGNIRGRVAELQDAAAAEIQITLQSLIEEAADIQKRAAKAGQYSAAIAALIAKAKLAGRWVERAEQKNTNVNYIVSDQPMTEEEWVAEHVTEH